MPTIPQVPGPDMLQIPPAPNSSNSVLLALAAPFLLQFAALLGIIIIVLVRDGVSTDTVITSLLAFLITNGVAGGAIGVTHVLTSNNIQREVVQKGPTPIITNGVAS